ncbi:MAG TPA: Asp-tRNA(Asn)/Glu-tRNA(Gln) amidotransferase subunit GatB [Gemmatimonadales bacterium]|jgi:aspartyl-tRNA(Asn)/glutamyl-tRNA(Gln) amidotransferase subunit B
MDWETVIGLEVHVQLATRSKMFCGCATTYGAVPNTNVCPICLGLPGALPVPNAEAIRLGTVGALALGCSIHDTSIFARKNYFYPDLPKGYQISQFDRPLATGGAVAVESPDRGAITISITRLHLEEDAGKSLHDRVPGFTAVDLNRAGTPLAEIVSGPDIRSPAEARAYLATLRQLLIYAGVSDCSMEKGSLRVDANLSVRKPGAPLGTKTEVKNMNSFANVERALHAERERQIALLESGERVQQVTLTFNAANGTVKPLRVKEDSHDYRYFPDPDLPPLVLEPAWIAAQEGSLPELPAARIARYMSSYGITAYDARVLTQEPRLSLYFEKLVDEEIDPKVAANWVMGELRAQWPDLTLEPPVEAGPLSSLIRFTTQGFVSGSAAKQVFEEMVARPLETPAAIIEYRNLRQVSDNDALGAWIDAILADHPKEVERYRNGETRLIGFFVGQVMKRSAGKADPKAIQPIIVKRLAP